MKSVPEPGTVLIYDGELMRVVGIGEGRTIHMRSLERDPCPTCHRPMDVELLEHSNLFQEKAQAVPTLGGDVDGSV